MHTNSMNSKFIERIEWNEKVKHNINSEETISIYQRIGAGYFDFQFKPVKTSIKFIR